MRIVEKYLNGTEILLYEMDEMIEAGCEIYSLYISKYDYDRYAYGETMRYYVDSQSGNYEVDELGEFDLPENAYEKFKDHIQTIANNLFDGEINEIQYPFPSW